MKPRPGSEKNTGQGDDNDDVMEISRMDVVISRERSRNWNIKFMSK